jgi:predicted phosphoribosyltransferase
MVVYEDRREAGKILAESLEKYRGVDGVILAIPRGGVVLGDVIAKALDLPLDVVITRKIGAPGNPEFAIGAISMDGTRILDEPTIRILRVPEEYIDNVAAEQMAEVTRRTKRYRGSDVYDLKGKTAIVVDDGIATGYTAIAALKYVRNLGPSKLVFAVPVGSSSAACRIRPLVDELVCLDTPWNFQAVSQFYSRFEQINDEDAVKIMREYKKS